jgi:hypothetical protein
MSLRGFILAECPARGMRELPHGMSLAYGGVHLPESRCNALWLQRGIPRSTFTPTSRVCERLRTRLRSESPIAKHQAVIDCDPITALVRH